MVTTPVPAPPFDRGFVFENEPDEAVAPGGSIVNVTVFGALELFHTCSGNVRNGASPGEGVVFAVVGVVMSRPKLTFASRTSVLREPPTSHAGRPFAPWVHAV